MSTNFNSFNYLVCQVCSKYYLNPIILPCGNNICEEHVEKKLKSNSSKIYKCDICFKEHETSENGYIINRILINMMNDNIHLSEESKQKKTLIEELNNVKKDIDSITKDPEGFIYTYFAKETNKIDLKRETLIEKINDISEEMIETIKQLEKDCKLNLDEKKKHVELIDFDDERLEEKIAKLGEEVRDPTAFESDNKFELDDDLLRKNENKLLEAKNKLFDEKGCYFVVNNNAFKDEYFGKLVINDPSTINNHEKYDLDINSYSIYENALKGSTILTQYQVVDLQRVCQFNPKKSFRLLYRASIDGFDAKDFHSKCDKIEKTLTIIKVEDSPHIFGGYTEVTWEGTGFKQDKMAFIFSLLNNFKEPFKMIINENIDKAIYCNPNNGPTFGGGHDFNISSNSNRNEESYSNLGHTYQHPEHHFSTVNAREYLTGSYKFMTNEIEVYQVIIEDKF